MHSSTQIGSICEMQSECMFNESQLKNRAIFFICTKIENVNVLEA